MLSVILSRHIHVSIQRLGSTASQLQRQLVHFPSRAIGGQPCNQARSHLQLTFQRIKILMKARTAALQKPHICKHLSRLGLCTLGISGFGLGKGLSLIDWQRIFPVAACKSKRSQRHRLSHEEDDEDTDPDFQWDLFLNLLRHDLLLLVAAVLAAIAAAVVNIQIPSVLGEVTNIVSRFTNESAQNVETFLEQMKTPALRLLGLYCVQSLFTFCYISLLAVVGENMASRMRKQLFHSLLIQDIEFFDKHKTGKLIDRLTSDVQDFKSAFKLTVSQGLKATTQSVGCIVSLFMVSPKLTFIMLGVVPIVVAIGSCLGTVLRAMSRDAQEEIAKSTAIANEALGNIRTVRAFAMEPKELELYEVQVERSQQTNINLGIGIGAFQGGANLFLNGIVLGSLFAGGWLISNQELKAGDLISFLVSSQMVERSLAQISLLFGNVVKGLTAGARVFEFIDQQPKIPMNGGKKIAFHSLLGDIEFTNVTFHYPQRKQQNVLTNFSLRIPGGKVIALVGISGGGKSTVASLLERFYDVEEGKVTLDGYDIKELDPAWLRGRAIGFINQEPVLFATSVMENIRYGRPDATDEEVKEAAKLANAESFILGFPRGYETVLGERGVTVSGGQKQRIAIARALIKNPAILILDEATSALDTESERIVQEALDQVVRGRTTVVIAHRLSTVRNADMIAVISKGKIVELGSHNQLYNKKGFYWELMQKQELEDDLWRK